MLAATLFLAACGDSDDSVPEPAEPVVEAGDADGVSGDLSVGEEPAEVRDGASPTPEAGPDIAAADEAPAQAARADAGEGDPPAAEAPADEPPTPPLEDPPAPDGAAPEAAAEGDVSVPDPAAEPAVDGEPEPAVEPERNETVALDTPAPAPAPNDAGAAEAVDDPDEIVLPDFVNNPPPLEGETLARLSNGDVDDGRTFAQRCVGCHSFRDGGQGPDGPQLGPILYGIVGRVIGNQDGFDYSPVFELMNETGVRWSATMLDAFLTNPTEAAHGTAMSYAVPDSEDRANVIAYLRTLADDPLPLGADPAEAAAAHSDTAELLQRIADANVDDGRDIAARCSGCHRFDPDAAPLTGPNLYDFVGGPVASVEGFDYSNALGQLAEEGAVWSYARLDAFLESPAIAVPGTRMGFGGIADPADRAALIAYLRTLSPDPFPLDLAVAVVDETEGIGVVRDDLNPLTFSISQATYGDRYYSEFGCEDCHGGRLQGVIDMRDGGIGTPPALVGPNFERRWFDGNVYALYDMLSSTMPPDSPGGLEELFYADILAYILLENGFEPGTTILPVDRAILEAMGFYQ